MRLIVGLGNPGPRYTGTRHNAGFLVLDELARVAGLRFRNQRGHEVADWDGVLLLKPGTYMNRSGAAVQATMSRSRIPLTEVVVVHDDLDLPLGRLRLRQGGGGAGGQRGVQDIIGNLGPDFGRLKLGISRPPDGWATENWVLSRFREEELPLLREVVTASVRALRGLREEGWERTGNWLNGLDLRPGSKSQQEASQQATEKAPDGASPTTEPEEGTGG